MTKTEVFADALQPHDVIMFEVAENEYEIRRVDGIMPNGPWTVVYVDEGAPIHFFRNQVVEVVSGPSKNS